MTNGERSKSLENDVREWLNKSGFPLEMRTVKKIREFHPIAISQSTYYRDPTTDTLREIDVKAAWCRVVNPPMFVHLVVECKSSTAPWVLFRGQGRPFTESDQRLMFLQSALSSFKMESDGSGMPRYIGKPYPALMKKTSEGCYAIKQKAATEKNAKDQAFEATRQVVSSAYALHGREYSDTEPSLSSFTFALVVTTSPLFVAKLDENNEISVTATDREMVLVPLPHGSRSIQVHVVNESALHDFMTDFHEFTRGLLLTENLTTT